MYVYIYIYIHIYIYIYIIYITERGREREREITRYSIRSHRGGRQRSHRVRARLAVGRRPDLRGVAEGHRGEVLVEIAGVQDLCLSCCFLG